MRNRARNWQVENDNTSKMMHGRKGLYHVSQIARDRFFVSPIIIYFEITLSSEAVCYSFDFTVIVFWKYFLNHFVECIVATENGPSFICNMEIVGIGITHFNFSIFIDENFLFLLNRNAVIALSSICLTLR